MRGDLPSAPPGLSPADDALLAELARSLVRRGLAAPAIVTLECLRPAAFLGGQVMRMLQPLVQLISEGKDWERLAQILEVRGSVERLLAHLEAVPSAAAQAVDDPPVPDAAYVVVDCGSTTTKAVLIARREGRFRLVGRAESPTTVEAPTEDVMVGVQNALRLLQQQTGHVLVDDAGHLEPATGPRRGVGRMLATSSAGGGLQMVVAGLVREMTAASAERAALGAGAIVADVVAWNDRDTPAERIERLRRSRPDMVLLAGGTDGGATDQVVGLAEQLAAADLSPRWGSGRLPVVYAGNGDASAAVEAVLALVAEVAVAPNLRPDLETERLAPVRAVLHEVFLRHVMVRAPGYPRLQAACRDRVLPTPAGFGRALELLGGGSVQTVAVDLGGATCDVFSVRDGEVYRSVSANLGLSFSLGAVCERAGWAQVARWLPMAITEEELRDRVRNKMIRPTTLPQTPEDLLLEQAVAREAIRLALDDHAAAVAPLRGRRDVPRGVEALRVEESTPGGIDWGRVELVLGSGGPLAHAPRRRQAAAILLDACRPQGVTRLAVDSVFVLPHLGVLRQADESAACDVITHDAIVELGTVISPIGDRSPDPDEPLAMIRARAADANAELAAVGLRGGELKLVPLIDGPVTVEIETASGWDFGAGPGRTVTATVVGGPAGLILDGRGAGPALPAAELSRRETVRRWLLAMDALPGEALA